MADVTFNTPAGQTIDRELLVLYLNTGTKETPVWSALGKRVESGSMSYDYEKDTKKDILGNTFTTMKKPTITQSFDALPLDADDTAAKKIYQLAVHDQNAQALASMDIMVAHLYSDWAERYDASAISISDFGGDGGGAITMSTEVTFGGTRTLGTATKSGNTVTFTAA